MDERARLTNEEDRRGTVLYKCACPGGSSRGLAQARTACQAQPHVRPLAAQEAADAEGAMTRAGWRRWVAGRR